MNNNLSAEKSLSSWTQGINFEVEWWDEWCQRIQVESPKWFGFRTQYDSSLQDEFINLLDVPATGTANILDVGAGPLTTIGKIWKGRDVKITAIDPLAEAYDLMLLKHHIEPPVRTLYGMAESLTQNYPKNYFDLVHAHNSLDHSFDPVRGIHEMLQVVKPECSVYLRHAQNEGKNASYVGFHQWNFYLEKGDFFIEGYNKVINVSELFVKIAFSQTYLDEKGKVITIFKKNYPGS